MGPQSRDRNSNLNRLKNFTERFRGKFVVKWISHCTLHVATLPCEKLMSVKQLATDDKLQGSVATYLRCGGVANNQIKKRFIAEFVSEIFLNQ